MTATLKCQPEGGRQKLVSWTGGQDWPEWHPLSSAPVLLQCESESYSWLTRWSYLSPRLQSVPHRASGALQSRLQCTMLKRFHYNSAQPSLRCRNANRNVLPADFVISEETELWTVLSALAVTKKVSNTYTWMALIVELDINSVHYNLISINSIQLNLVRCRVLSKVQQCVKIEEILSI